MAKAKADDSFNRGNFSISLTVGGETIKSSGVTMLEAVNALKVPLKIVTKGTLKATHGDKEVELFYPPIRIKRLLYPIARNITAKRLITLLK